ncbi:MAG: hypothetical protein HRT45_09065 [Bdellovibrionales bacterium]|nr:hypothetical protein [Bdellovibrionales bacterium]
MRTPPWIVITGADGVGKSSCIERLTGHFEKHGLRVSVASIWDGTAKHFPQLSQSDIQSYLTKIDGTARCLFLLHAMQASLMSHLESADFDLLIVDSYFYKYWVTERVLGTDMSAFDSVAATFPVPDLVIELKAPLSVVRQRRQNSSLYEKLQSAGLNDEELEACIDQSWSEVREKFGPFVSVPNLEGPEDLIVKLNNAFEVMQWNQSL